MIGFIPTCKEILSNNNSTNQTENIIYNPLFFRIEKEDEKQRLMDLLIDKPYIKVCDTISSQLKELIKSAQPSKTFTTSEILQGVEIHLNGISLEDYGVWVYYPWSEKLVHILDEKEFVDLRTNRNNYKITDAEEIQLSSKKIGVIGLSVGQSVSLTLAMERSFGELRIADFDELEITNLNRLRSGIHNMGIKKTVLVAREIAEIDPFLKVTCFHEGITDNNIESFLLENGKLDVLIDECDSVDVKIKCRIAARNHRIPVLMEASDRGTIDIERFDLEPGRPVLHGLIEHLDISKIKGLQTNEEKLPFILPIVGIETMSTRLRASAVEVGQTISTWPQLASAVTMGGGITADVCRRMLLGHLHQSGRFFIDIEELISDPKEVNQTFDYHTEPLTKEKMAAIAASNSPKKLEGKEESIVDEKTIITLVQAAAIAPSAGNNQPWKWYFDAKNLFLFHDIERSASFGDFENMASYMALGTAIENLKLKATELNIKAEASLFPDNLEKCLVAVFTLEQLSLIQNDELVNYLKIRFTNRNIGNNLKIDSARVEEIKSSISTIHGSALHLIEDDVRLQQLAEIAGKAEKLRLFIPQGHYDLFEKELRWTPENAEHTKDGLDVRTLDLSQKDAVGFQVIKDQKAIKLISEWNGGKALENMTRRLVSTSSAVGLISMPTFTPQNCISAGQAAERVWLTANKHLISLQPVLAPLLHFARINHGRKEDMPKNIYEEFIALNMQFQNIFGQELLNREPLFFFRLCYSENPKVKSLRLDLKDVYFSDTLVK